MYRVQVGMVVLLFLGLISIWAPPALASEFENLVREVSSEIRCPICKGLSAWESDTAPSRTIVDDVRIRLSRGETTVQILAAYEQEYGPWILMRPPRRGFSWSAYLAPLAVVAGGAGVILAALRGPRRKPPAEPDSDTAEDDAYVEQVQRILRDNL